MKIVFKKNNELVITFKRVKIAFTTALSKFTRFCFFVSSYIIGICLCAIALLTSLYVGEKIEKLNILIKINLNRYFLHAIAIIIGYITFGIVLMIILIIINRILPGSKWEGERDVNDWRNASFFISEASLILAEHLFLPLIRGTPLLSLFYRGMGAKIGKGTVIASLRVNDWRILEIGSNCIIGGDCVLNGHSGERGKLIRKRVHIGDRVTIGQYTTILPGVYIEDDVVVGANSLVPKNRILKSGCTFGGVPAVVICNNNENYSRVDNSISEKNVESIKHQGISKISTQESITLLLESYKLRFSEILAIESFISSVSVGSLSAMAGLFVYAIVSNKAEMIAFLPILAALSGMVILSLISSMNVLGFHMAKFELLLQLHGANGFDWESTEGAMANSKSEKLPGIIITVVFIIIYIASLYLTFWGPLLRPNMIFLGFNLRTVAVVVDTAFGVACIATYLYTTIQNRLLNKKLKNYKKDLGLA